MQELIKLGGYEAKNAAEVTKLEKKLEKMRELHEERVSDRKFKLSKVTKKNRELHEENQRLEATVAELAAAVAERENISKVRRTQELFLFSTILAAPFNSPAHTILTFLLLLHIYI